MRVRSGVLETGPDTVTRSHGRGDDGEGRDGRTGLVGLLRRPSVPERVESSVGRRDSRYRYRERSTGAVGSGVTSEENERTVVGVGRGWTGQ